MTNMSMERSCNTIGLALRSFTTFTSGTTDFCAVITKGSSKATEDKKCLIFITKQCFDETC